MTGLRLALANLKPGTGKTTSAVWLAHVFALAGNSVLLVDADPSGSALEWSDLAAMDPHLASPEATFPFRIVALPSRELHRRLPEIAREDDVVIIDTPQMEDHAAIARSALRYADEIVIPCAPNPIEINRTTPIRDEITEVDPRQLDIEALACGNRSALGGVQPQDIPDGSLKTWRTALAGVRGVAIGGSGLLAVTVGGCRRRALSSPLSLPSAVTRRRWLPPTASPGRGSMSCWPATGPKERQRSNRGRSGRRTHRRPSAPSTPTPP